MTWQLFHLSLAITYHLSIIYLSLSVLPYHLTITYQYYLSLSVLSIIVSITYHTYHSLLPYHSQYYPTTLSITCIRIVVIIILMRPAAKSLISGQEVDRTPATIDDIEQSLIKADLKQYCGIDDF